MELILVAGVAAMALVLGASQLTAASSPAPIGMPNCTTSCGNVSVPYPFGFGPAHCYWPGFKLTCDASGHGPPRLLLGGDHTLRVVDIFLANNTVRVVRTGAINITAASRDGGVSTVFAGGLSAPYMLSDGNELVLVGCNVQATLLGVYSGNDTDIIGGCASPCSWADEVFGWIARDAGKICRGMGCCQSAVSGDTVPTEVRYRRFDLNSSEVHDKPMLAFVAEEGWFDQRPVSEKLLDAMGEPSRAGLEAPVVLRWAVKHGGLEPDGNLEFNCSEHVARRLCKSRLSNCWQKNNGYACYCNDGYGGNPYVTDGCQDIDECKLSREEIGCFGECINKIGSHECRCPEGTQGNYTLPSGCVPLPFDKKSSVATGSIIAIAVGSGAGSIFLVVIAIFMTQRYKHMRTIKLKQKNFKQNRGQLLQQLVSQRTDIAERMIISIDELSKATNHFDKARELGGGGHGTVYKGILSDQHVVAIKKSKITVQKEIDEFINEVAILSQINHRNVVKLFGCCLETEVPLLVYEFISNGTLYHHLHIEGPRSLPWGTRLRIATETSSALAYLHSSVSIPVIHRDIKSSNILLDDTLTSKVSDFGASRYIPMDKTGLTTRVQGTIGYLDPMYFYTGRLMEKSDVYSFGVILVELLTRKKPFSYLSSDGDGLVSHFVNLLAEGNLVQILDPQVIEEGGKEVYEVSILAASCIKLTGEDRPTMQQVEHTLKSLEVSNKKYIKDSIPEKIEENGIGVMSCWSAEDGQRLEESGRRYSLEQEVLLSASYPR